MRKKLRLYIWENVLTDYTSGVMFALAHSEDEARESIKRKSFENTGYPSSYIADELKAAPKVVEDVEGFYVWGGG